MHERNIDIFNNYPPEKKDNPLAKAYFRDSIIPQNLAILTLGYYRINNQRNNIDKIHEKHEKDELLKVLSRDQINDYKNLQFNNRSYLGLGLTEYDLDDLYLTTGDSTYEEVIADYVRDNFYPSTDYSNYPLDIDNPINPTTHFLNTILDIKRITNMDIATEDEWVLTLISAMRKTLDVDNPFTMIAFGKMVYDVLNLKGLPEMPFNVTVDYKGTKDLAERFLRLASPVEQANFKLGMNNFKVGPPKDIYNN